MRISDWSSDVCSSDLRGRPAAAREMQAAAEYLVDVAHGEGDMIEAALGLGRLQQEEIVMAAARRAAQEMAAAGIAVGEHETQRLVKPRGFREFVGEQHHMADLDGFGLLVNRARRVDPRSEEHTSELQSLMRISYAVFCLKKK